jgi:hypothetical protein
MKPAAISMVRTIREVDAANKLELILLLNNTIK